MEFRGAPEGSVVLHVERRNLACEDFRLRMMFAAGVGVFPTPQDLNSFAKGSLAQAFGIELDERCPGRASGQILNSSSPAEPRAKETRRLSLARLRPSQRPAEPAAVPEAEARKAWHFSLRCSPRS